MRYRQVGFFSKRNLFETASNLGEVAGKSYAAIRDATIDGAKTIERAISIVQDEFQKASESTKGGQEKKTIEVTVLPPVTAQAVGQPTSKTIRDVPLAAVPKVEVPKAAILLCSWKNCSASRAPDGDHCNHHQRENEQFKARQCGNKLRHLTLEDARIHAAARSHKTGDQIVAYSCRVCNYFHIGHSQVEERQFRNHESSF